MSLSIYDASVSTFTQMLKNLDAILDKAAPFAEAKKFDVEVLLNDRLAPDMFNLIHQLQIACDFAKGASARLAGVENPKFEDTEKTLPELKNRIQKTIGFIGALAPEKFAGAETREINLTVGGNPMQFVGAPYLLGFALPNFYFHMTMVYAILRHNGVDVGKRDFVKF